MEPRVEALRWLLQAENDLAYARLGLREGFHAQVCFQCQQICGKAIKSIHYGHLAQRVVYGHSLVELARSIELDAPFRRELAILDQYYIPTPYPNALPGGLPFEVCTAEQAAAAVATCDRLIALARTKLPTE